MGREGWNSVFNSGFFDEFKLAQLSSEHRGRDEITASMLGAPAPLLADSPRVPEWRRLRNPAACASQPAFITASVPCDPR
jgi:hypothetical protein